MSSMRKTSKSSSANSATAEKIGLDDDVLTDILIRDIPVKTLLKFKLVSKQWQSLISSPTFSHVLTRTLHAKGRLKPCGLYYRRAPNAIPLASEYLSVINIETQAEVAQIPALDFMAHLPKVYLLQSCTGLLLCVSYNKISKRKRDGFNEPSQETYFVCNPTTKKLRILSSPPLEPEDVGKVGVVLAFDPLKSPYYKVISFWSRNANPTTFSLYIYSSETNSWSSSKSKLTSDSSIHSIYVPGPVVCNGAIHWYCWKQRSVHCLDVEKEDVRITPLPKLSNEDDKVVGDRFLGECGGHLRLAIARQHPPWFTFSFFEMAEDYSGWHFMYNVDLKYHSDLGRGILNNYLWCGSHLLVYPTRYRKGDEAEFRLVPDGDVLRLKNGSLREMKRGLCYSTCSVFKYFETLACV